MKTPLLHRKKAETKIVRMVVGMSFKASTDDSTDRTFEGLAATWQEDLGNDVIHKGAFKETLKAWKASDEALPLLDSHDQFSIMSALGQLLDAKETDKGLWTKWEVIDGPEGDAVLARLRPSKLAKRSIVGKMSIGFIPEEFNFVQPKGTESFWDRIRHITKASLKEVSLVLFPMNPGAAIDAATVKSFMISAENTDPRVLDALTRKQLRQLAGRIGVLLKKQKPQDEEQDEDDSDDDTDDSTSTRTNTPPTPSTKTDLEEVADDDEDEIESDDADDTDDDTDEDESEEDDTGEEGKSANDNAALPIYQFTDALAQRIAKLNLTQRVEELTNNS